MNWLLLIVLGSVLAIGVVTGMLLERRARERAPRSLERAQEAMREGRYEEVLRELSDALYVPAARAFSAAEAVGALAALELLDSLQDLARTQWVDCEPALRALRERSEGEYVDRAVFIQVRAFLETAGWDPVVVATLYEAAKCTGLQRLASEGDVEGIVRMLEREGADVNEFVDAGYGTPLIAAIASGQFEAVGVLLAHGADANRTNHRDRCALWVALLHDVDLEIIELLLGAGADPDRPLDGNGLTPLMFAAGRGDLALARCLVAAGADLERRDVVGRTALRWASAPVEELLLDLMGEDAWPDERWDDDRRDDDRRDDDRKSDDRKSDDRKSDDRRREGRAGGLSVPT